jgi:hypothetical protein
MVQFKKRFRGFRGSGGFRRVQGSRFKGFTVQGFTVQQA